MNAEKDYTTLADGGFTASLDAIFQHVVNYGNTGLPSTETDFEEWEAAVKIVEAELNAWAEAGAVGRFYIGDEWVTLVD